MTTAIKYFVVNLVLLHQLSMTMGNLGVDVSSLVSSSSFRCLKSMNYNFAIVRAFRSVGTPDYDAPKTISNARQEGIKMIDAYMFPCAKCGNAEKQVEDMLKLSLNVGMIWLDIERYSTWFSDKSKNRLFFEDLVAALQNHFPIGVYTSLNNWSTLMGLDYTKGSPFPLWYAHYDGQPGFDDFRPFAGWQKPALKQFAENHQSCGVDVDINWRP